MLSMKTRLYAISRHMECLREQVASNQLLTSRQSDQSVLHGISLKFSLVTMAANKTVIVLAPNGRRQNVKVTINTTILQVSSMSGFLMWASLVETKRKEYSRRGLQTLRFLAGFGGGVPEAGL